MSESVTPMWKMIVETILALVVVPICAVLYIVYVILPGNPFRACISLAGVGVYVGFLWGGAIHIAFRGRPKEASR